MAQPLTDAINALTQYANEVTGASDQTLSDAVRTLCDGYGGGGVSADDIASRSIPNLGHITLTVSTIDYYAFYNLASVTGITANAVTLIRDYGLANTDLSDGVSMPLLERVEPNGLNGVNFPAVMHFSSLKRLENYSMRGSTGIETAVFPIITYVGTMAFQTIRSMKKLDLGGEITNTFSASCFAYCNNLDTLIIRKTGGVITINNINAFAQTPFANGYAGGTLYVPQALISSYQSANIWSTILGYANNQILPIEGSIYETQYADGTPIE